MSRILTLLVLISLAAGSARAELPTSDAPTRTLYLVRHGEYEHGIETPDEGGLVALGRQQARMLAARLDAMPVAFTAIHASTMTRARETAEILAARFDDLTVELRDDIRECTPSTRRQDIMDDLEPGEAQACESTLAAAWQELARPPAEGDGDLHEIVVCHGNVIRWFVCRALDVDPQAWLGMSIANCSLTTLRIHADGSVKLFAFADSGHIPWEMTTYPGVTTAQ